MFSKIKNHPIKLGATLLAATILTGSAPYVFAGKHVENTTKNITQNNLSMEQTEQSLNLAITKYINRAPDVFEIDNTLLETLNHEIILMSLLQLNRLFEKYEGFTKSFINYHRKNKTKFTLKFDDNTHYDLISYKASFISLTPLATSSSAFVVTAHEFGHIIQYILANNIYNKLSDQCMELNNKAETTDELKGQLERLNLAKSCFKLYLDSPTTIFGDTFAESIKCKIVNDLPDNDTTLTLNSKKNAHEYFAEAFMLLELSSSPGNILSLPPEYLALLNKPVLKNLENFLVNDEIGFLPKENSKFNK